MKHFLMVAAVVVGLGGCATVDTSKLPRMGVDFAFDAKHKCQGVSPEIRLTNVPSGVATYEVKMTDLDVPSFRHWDEKLPATGSRVAEGAAKQYYGPCPPSGTHRYEIAVTAKDAQGKAIAYGEKMVMAGR
jgi:phosphatidylethanolamine-binding protein (PEBP) family uncharacterized protein